MLSNKFHQLISERSPGISRHDIQERLQPVAVPVVGRTGPLLLGPIEKDIDDGRERIGSDRSLARLPEELLVLLEQRPHRNRD